MPVPRDGERITYRDGRIQVPSKPIIPFIEGDGTGRDIWKASVRVFDAAVEKAYGGKRHVAWYEIFAGEKAKAKTGVDKVIILPLSFPVATSHNLHSPMRSSSIEPPPAASILPSGEKASA